MDETAHPDLAEPRWKLWIYTNYDCNLRCSYCVARSSPQAPRRPIGLPVACRLVDEAAALGFAEVLFTGGEPLLLDEIYPMLAHAAARMPTTLLTNAMLLRGPRLARLAAVATEALSVQVSLDGATPEAHDAYRGRGSWARTVEGIRALLAAGLRVRLSTTETPANTGQIEAIHAFRRDLGLPDEAHVVRPLARRGFAEEGLEVSAATLAPELTASVDGIFWHPLSTDEDMLVSPDLFPLAAARDLVLARLAAPAAAPRATFT